MHNLPESQLCCCLFFRLADWVLCFLALRFGIRDCSLFLSPYQQTFLGKDMWDT